MADPHGVEVACPQPFARKHIQTPIGGSPCFHAGRRLRPCLSSGPSCQIGVRHTQKYPSPYGARIYRRQCHHSRDFLCRPGIREKDEIMEASNTDYYDCHYSCSRSPEAQILLKDASRRVEEYCITAIPSCSFRRVCRSRRTSSFDGPPGIVSRIIPIGAFGLESKVRR